MSAKILIPVMRPLLPSASELVPYLQQIDRNRHYSNFGPLLHQFEARLAQHFELEPTGVVTVTNGTVALMLALKHTLKQRVGALDKNKYCLMPSWTFSATAHAAMAAGLTPLFLDVAAGSWALTPAIAAEALKKIAPSEVAAVVPVSVFGAAVDGASWDTFSAETGVPVVIDAAAAFDVTRPVRTPAMVSLHATKALGCGEGAVVLTQDFELAAQLRSLTTFAFNNNRESLQPALNAKLSEYVAAVGLASLDQWAAARAEFLRLKQEYIEEFSAYADEVEFAPGTLDEGITSTINVYFRRPVAFHMMELLREQGIETKMWWTYGCHAQAAFRTLPRLSLPVTEAIIPHVLGLPFYRGMTREQIQAVVAGVAQALTRLEPGIQPSAPVREL